MLREAVCSPVPTQTMDGLEGATVTSPIEITGWVSKIGSHDTPALTDFHSPPEPVAM